MKNTLHIYNSRFTEKVAENLNKFLEWGEEFFPSCIIPELNLYLYCHLEHESKDYIKTKSYA